MKKPDQILLSVSQAADEFGCRRSTFSKRLRRFKIQPSGTRRGWPVYQLHDLIAMERAYRNPNIDPESLTEYERLAFFKGESARLKVNLERGRLLRCEDVDAEWARVLRAIALELDTVVDEIERDVGAAPAVLEKIERKVLRIREILATDIHYGNRPAE